jgi:hypothetical protein
MGGGFRSIPPTSLPFATLKPGQTRHLPTRLVSLSTPNGDGPVALPEKGETLKIGDIGQLTRNERIQKALKRLAVDKAPPTVSQLVMWRVGSGLEWDAIAELSKNWANASELTLAQRFVAQLDTLPDGESGSLLCQITASSASLQAVVDQVNATFKGQMILGLAVKPEVPAQPEGPSVACKVTISGTAEKPEALVLVATTDAAATSWAPAGKFTLPLVLDKGKVKGAEFADALAEGILGRLVRATLGKGPVIKGKLTYKVKIDNSSPLILNGVGVLGIDGKTGDTPKVLAGISVPPGKSFTIPATGQMVEELGLKKGVRVIAADLSGL